jgi:hypothetical protein
MPPVRLTDSELDAVFAARGQYPSRAATSFCGMWRRCCATAPRLVPATCIAHASRRSVSTSTRPSLRMRRSAKANIADYASPALPADDNL